MYLSTISSRLLLFDTSSWELKKSYGCYDGLLRDISWSDDSKYLLQVNNRGLVEVLTASDHEVRSLQHIPVKDTWSASFHRDGHRNIAIGSKSGNVLIWDTKNKTITKTFPTPSHHSKVNFVSFNAKNSMIAATMKHGLTIIYSLASNIPVTTVQLPYSMSISAMKFHRESRSLLGLATEEGHVVLRDLTTNKDKVFFENIHQSPVSDFAYSLVNKDVMLSCGYDKIMNVYDVRLQNVVSTTRTAFALTSLAINIDNQVALGTKQGTVLLYDLRDLTSPLKVLRGHDNEVQKVAFQPLRRKLNSTEISLQEEPDPMLSPSKLNQLPKKSSDMFYVNNSPPQTPQEKIAASSSSEDRFLVLMGLDTSKTSEIDCNSIVIDKDQHIERFHHLEAERDDSKTSTPNTNSRNNNVLDSLNHALCSSSPCDKSNRTNDEEVKINFENQNTIPKSNETEELKDFIRVTMGEYADDNRNYFLHIMMALTKQKLYLEKQLSAVNVQMRALSDNQNALVEINRKLALEIDMLKDKNSNHNRKF